MKYTCIIFFLFSFSIQLWAQPTNDECAGAIDLGILPYCETTVFSNINSTASNIGNNLIPACFNGGAVNNDVWFSFNLPAGEAVQNFKISLTATQIAGILNPQLAIYRGDCAQDQLSQLDLCSTTNQGEYSLFIEAIGLKPNTQYFLRVNDYSQNATPNWGNFTLCIETLAPFFIMGENDETGLCSGTLFDSGGPDGNYDKLENHNFTICPTEFHRCIAIEVLTYDIEFPYDKLHIYAGADNNTNLLTTISGVGRLSLINAESDCVTINFTSDPSQNHGGFLLNWQCSSALCPEIPEITCDNPHIIPAIPFQKSNLSTCFAGNNLETGPCREDDFIEGKEYIFSYDSPGGECIAISVNGVIPASGLQIVRGCPSSEEAVCINQIIGEEESASLFLPNVSLKEKGNYYFIIANENNCTPFDIAITKSSTCPKVLPAAAKCKDALILNGCDPNLPTALTVEPSAGDPDFFKFGVNNGCWDEVFETNYTWFTFEAQGDGEFAFLLSNNDPDAVVDIDFNIWGPYENLEESCFGSDNQQPIRSSWADDLIYSITGLANTNPILETPIINTCEGAFGEGFLKPLQVKKGEVYLVLINDYDGVIFNGAIAIDFSGTEPGVLAALSGQISTIQDTFICGDNNIELSLMGASAYEWFPSESLTCKTCPNPIANPTKTTTYTIEASTVCSTVSEEIRVEVIQANAGIDKIVCHGASVSIDASVDASDITYLWNSPNGVDFLSCSDCPNPIITPTNPGSFEYILEVSNSDCRVTDTMLLTVIEGKAPVYEIANNQEICLGEAVNLGGISIEGQQYQWRSLDSSFNTNEVNPLVSPITTSTYFLEVSTAECSVSSLDSVTIQVKTPPVIKVRTDTTICEATSIRLGNTVIEAGVNYLWSTADINSLDQPNIANAIAQPSINSKYILSADNGACRSSDSVSVTVLPINLNFENEGANKRICLGTGLDLNISFSPTTAQPEIISLDRSLDTNATTLFIQPTNNQTYIALMESDGCIASDTIHIMVDSLPKNMVISPMDTTVCRGTQLVLSSPIYDPQFYPKLEHKWSPNIGFDTPDSFYNLVITPLDSLVLKRINQNGACIDTSITVLNVLPFIEVMITPEKSIICESESITLMTNLPEGATNINWIPTEGLSCSDCPNTDVFPLQNTNYTITGNIMDCLFQGAAVVEVIDFSGTTLLNLGPSEIFIGQQVDSIILSSNLLNINTIEWLENGQIIRGANDPILKYTPLANESISKETRWVEIIAKIETDDGCSFEASTNILIKPPAVPNAFTPGEDGVNDFFNILLPETNKYVTYFKIYNRWGKLVYDNNAPATGWNGQLHNTGKIMPADVYLYKIQYLLEDKIQTLTGNVTLIR